MYLNGYRCSVDRDSGSLCTPHDVWNPENSGNSDYRSRDK